MKKKLIPALTAGIAGIALLVGPAVADASAHNNIAMALTNSPNHQTKGTTAFQVNQGEGLVVVDHNRAQAESNDCDGCKAAATSVQIALASGPVVRIAAINTAIATQFAATNSQTCASAYQFIIAPDQTVRFSADGLAAINAIRANVTAITASTDDCATITAMVAGQMDDLAGVLGDPGSYTFTTVAPMARLAAAVRPSVSVQRYSDVQSAG